MPQTVNVDMVFVPRSQLPDAPAAKEKAPQNEYVKNAEEEKAGWDLAGELDETEKEIRKWESANHQNMPGEMKIQDEKLGELRIKRADIERRLKSPSFEQANAYVQAVVPNTMHSISKGQVINAFGGLHFSPDYWSKYLSSPPNWLKKCRVTKGKQGDNKVTATWNPIQIAVALLDIDKSVTIEKLDTVFFVRLKDWAEEWQDESELLR